MGSFTLAVTKYVSTDGSHEQADVLAWDIDIGDICTWR